MSNTCTIANRSESVATILERIPRSDEEGVRLLTLCPSATPHDPSCAGCAITLLTLLQIFDVITTTSGDNLQELRVKAKSQTALYFLRSLAIYVRKNLKLVSNWEREGIGSDLPLADAFASGAQFVYLMEQKRTVEYGDLSPIRRQIVAQAVIKARVRGRHEPMYLVQYDAQAHRFQLIGGRKRSTDSNILTVMQREIDEELAQNHLKYHKDYELRELVSDLQIAELSPTYGAYSEYHFTIYQAFIKRQQLVLGPHDRWVTLAELMSRTAKDRVRVSASNDGSYIAELDKRLPGGLSGLQFSLDEVQSRPWSDVIREHRLQLIGLIIGIISLAIAVIRLLLGR